MEQYQPEELRQSYRALQSGETAVTGYHMPEWMIQRADYVSRILAVKHPYETERLPARKGVEW